MRKLLIFMLLMPLATGLVMQETQESGMWRASDSIDALSAAIKAVDRLTHKRNIPVESIRQAQHVVEGIKADVEAVEHGKLSKSAARGDISKAMKKLVSFSRQLQHEKLSVVGKLLDEHQHRIEKLAEEAKLQKLRMELQEKKLQLQRREEERRSESKNQAASTQHVQVEHKLDTADARASLETSLRRLLEKKIAMGKEGDRLKESRAVAKTQHLQAERKLDTADARTSLEASLRRLLEKKAAMGKEGDAHKESKVIAKMETRQVEQQHKAPVLAPHHQSKTSEVHEAKPMPTAVRGAVARTSSHNTVAAKQTEADAALPTNIQALVNAANAQSDAVEKLISEINAEHDASNQDTDADTKVDHVKAISDVASVERAEERGLSKGDIPALKKILAKMSANEKSRM